MKEKFKSIVIDGITTNYIISNTGVLYSTNYNNTKKIKKRKYQIDKDGYYTIILHCNGKRYKYRINRLVAITFIKIPKKYIKLGLSYNDLVVHHKDHNIKNNHVNNLEWCTAKENIDEAEEYGTRKHEKGERHPMSKITEKTVKDICKTAINSNLLIRDLAKKYNTSETIVYNIIYELNWTDITSKYDLESVRKRMEKERKSRKSQNCSLTKYSDEMIISIADDIMKGGMTMEEISKKYNVSDSLVQIIKYKKIRTNLLKDYNFKIRKGN